jgi:hypothetical protein
MGSMDATSSVVLKVPNLPDRPVHTGDIRNIPLVASVLILATPISPESEISCTDG